MAHCIYCNFKFDAHDAVEGEVIAGDAYCKRCLYGDKGHHGESVIVPDVGACKRCKRDDTLGKHNRLCVDCSADMSS